MNLQRGDAIRNDLLIHQRPRRIMQQHPALAARPNPPPAARCAAEPAARCANRICSRDGGQGHPSRVRPGRATLDDVRDLAVAAVGEHGFDLFGVSARHHDEDLVDVRRLVEGGHAPLHQRLAAQGQQLLRHPRAEPLPHATAQHYRDHPHEPDSTAPPAQRPRLCPAHDHPASLARAAGPDHPASLARAPGLGRVPGLARGRQDRAGWRLGGLVRQDGRVGGGRRQQCNLVR